MVTNQKTLRLVQLALFTAIILLMAFTPIGYIKTGGLSITLLVLPVAVGAITLGPVSGAILGGIFGLTSFIQCFGLDPFGTTLLSIDPAKTFILCFVPRILMGWLTGLIFLAVKKMAKNSNISYIVGSLAGPLLNTIFFMPTFVWFFYDTDYVQGFATQLNVSNAFAFVVAFVGLNGLIEAAVNFVAGTAISKTIDVVTKKARA